MAEDPWLSAGKLISDPIQTFDDEFQPFAKMPDSDDYLKRLENKLARLKGCQQKVTSQGVITMLAMGRNDHMTRWMQENGNSDPNGEISDSMALPFPDSTLASTTQMSNIVRRILDPSRQALAEEELQCLVNCDHLQCLYSSQTNNIPSAN